MKVLITGDFCAAGRLGVLSESDPDLIFGDFAALIRSVDLAVVNLESPLCRPLDPIAKTGPNLCSAPATADFLARVGFGLVTLANNHILDFGWPGLEETFHNLEEAGLAYVGAGRSHADATAPYLATVDGRSLAILNFAENEWSTTRGDSPGANPIDPVKNHHAIRDARQRADEVLVICHGGHENHSLPSPRMQELFRFYIDAGASAVINHHTHCVSGYEIHHGGLIVYSLGNFLFDDPEQHSGPWTQGIAVAITFTGRAPSYAIYHFDQCTESSIFASCSPAETAARNSRIDQLNNTIADPRLLQESFSRFVELQTRCYQRYIEPRTFKLLEALQSRGMAPSFLRPAQRRLLLNLIRCEAHRDLLLEILERDVGYSR